MRRLALATSLLFAPVVAAPVGAEPPAGKPPAAVRPPASPLPAVLYHHDGRPASLADVVAAAHRADVLFVGEHHDDGTAHALEQAVFDALAPGGAQLGRPVALSLEMFDRDVQPVLDEYLAGHIRERDFTAAARPWRNYQADYLTLGERARERGIAVLAGDPPARYASRVGRLGAGSLAALPAPAHAWVAPSPWPSPSAAYAAKFNAFAQQVTGPGHGAAGEAAVRAMFEAQWLRDATMAATIAAWLNQRAGLVLHVTGGFHVAGGLGTPEALRHYRPGTRGVVLTILRDAGYPAFQPGTMAGAGDFVAITPVVRR